MSGSRLRDDGEGGRCPEVQDLLLEASPLELQGRGDGPVAEHVRCCARCRDVAGVLLQGQDGLDGALAGLGGASSDEDLLAAVRREVRKEILGGAVVRRLPRRSRLGAATVFLAAAALAGVLLMDGGEGVDPSGLPSAPVATTPTSDLEVNAERRFAVMKTDNPTINVVWFY